MSAKLPSTAEVLSDLRKQREALRVMGGLYTFLRAQAAFNQVHAAIAYVDNLIQYLEHHQ